MISFCEKKIGMITNEEQVECHNEAGQGQYLSDINSLWAM